MDILQYFQFCCFALICIFDFSEGIVYRLITETLQNNVAGAPVTHERTEWDFDPEVSKKRRQLYYEVSVHVIIKNIKKLKYFWFQQLNGYRGQKFIERIGVGIDGKENERRAAQEVRDIGRLNGAHYNIFL